MPSGAVLPVPRFCRFPAPPARADPCATPRWGVMAQAGGLTLAAKRRAARMTEGTRRWRIERAMWGHGLRLTKLDAKLAAYRRHQAEAL